jgi:RimJ/RimL family protein N-acetyltransferase
METVNHPLNSGQTLLLRDAVPEDAVPIIEYLEIVSGETDFLSFGQGEFDLDEAGQAEVLGRFLRSDNQIYILGLVDGVVAGALTFDGGSRPRLRHVGEFGMSVREDHWGLGIGKIMVQQMISWARSTGIVKKIDLKVREDNTRAIRMYELHGFVHEGKLVDQMRINGEPHDVFAMGLTL